MVLVNATQTYLDLSGMKESHMRKYLIRLAHGQPFDSWCGRAWSIEGNAIPGQVVLGGAEIPAEQNIGASH